MDLIDAIIIYLALGAPFGAFHYITRAKSGPAALAASGLAAVTWILFLPRLFHTQVESALNLSPSSALDRARRVNRVASTLSAALPMREGVASVFEIRELVERYAGLSDALSQAEEGNGFQTDFWAAAGNPAPEYAAMIHSRQNLVKLRLHRASAAKELRVLLGKLDRQSAAGKETEAALRELFLAFGDDELADPLIKSPTPDETGPEGLRIPGRMLWNASRQRQSANDRLLSLTKATLSPNLRSDD